MNEITVDQLILILALGAFVIAACSLVLSVVNSAVQARESRMQVIMTKLLEQDMANEGRPSLETMQMLQEKAPQKPVCEYLAREKLVTTYVRLRRWRRVIVVVYLGFLLFATGGLAWSVGAILGS